MEEKKSGGGTCRKKGRDAAPSGSQVSGDAVAVSSIQRRYAALVGRRRRAIPTWGTRGAAAPFASSALDFACLFVADSDEADGGSATAAVFVQEGGGAEEDFFAIECRQKSFDELFTGENAAGGFGGVGEKGVCEGGNFAADVVGEDAGLGGGFGCESPDA